LRIAFCLTALLFSFAADAQLRPHPTREELQGWMSEAFAKAEKMPASARELEDVPELDREPESREERIRQALLVIALRPQFYGPYHLLIAVAYPRLPEDAMRIEEAALVNRAEATEFLLELYRARAGTANEEQVKWQTGLAELLLMRGRYKEALPLARELAEGDGSPYVKVMAAVLEKLTGNDEPFTALMRACPDPPAKYAWAGKTYCTGVARSLANRMTHLMRREDIPAAIHDILTGRAEPQMDWTERLHSLRVLSRSDPDKAEPALNAMIDSKDAPAWAKDDAVLMLAEMARRTQNDDRALALADCWLARRGVTAPKMSADVWQAIIDLEPQENDWITVDIEQCQQHDVGEDPRVETNPSCMVAVLELRQFAARRDTLEIQRSLESLAALVVSTGRGLGNLARMLPIGAMMSSHPGDQTNMLRFAALLPVQEPTLQTRIGEAVRTQTERVSVPWQSPLAPPKTTSPCPR
jgi:hypothetical protein